MTPPREGGFEVADVVRRRALDAGESGRRWLADLDRTVAALTERWELRVEGVLRGGSASLVLAVARRDGARAVLKLRVPSVDGLDDEALVYELAGGRGLARMLARDRDSDALLIERLGTPLAHLDWPVDAQIAAICRALRSLWRAPAADAPLVTGRRKALWLADFVGTAWAELHAPCDVRTRDRALEFAGERAGRHSVAESVLAHGDAHAHNAMTLPGEGDEPGAPCKLIDPEGLFAEPACDLAVPMREWSGALRQAPGRLARQRCALLAELCGVDERAIWQWGFVERVSTGLLLMRLGHRRDGAETLAVAERLAQEVPPPG